MSSSPPTESGSPTSPWWRRVLPATLTNRLVAVVIALVAVVGVLVAGATALAMRSYLTDQRDGSLAQAFDREQNPPGFGGTQPCPLDTSINGTGPRFTFVQGSGTLTVRADCAYRATARGRISALTSAEVNELSSVPADGAPHSVDVSGLGSYRAMSDGDTVVALPLNDVQQAVRNLVLWELALTLTGVLLAALAGSELVRRTLKPLRSVATTAHEVTQQPLESGDTTIRSRVPGEYTDPATEVGQVGSALNTLLDHVDHALAARHRSEQQVRQFVADASHELRTPLSTIHGYAELSRRTPEDAAQLSASMAKVETEADRMSGLVEDMLLLARLDSGRPLVREEVDVTRLLLEAVADARVVGTDHRWQLDLPEEPLLATGDEQRLHQAVTNLLNNARNHTPAGTTVTVAAAPSEANVRITVSDDGPGIPEELLPHAFERFTRGDQSRTRASGGAGLGLSLVDAIVTAHGGTVTVDSRPGATEFTLTLPAGH
ncbi:MAG TPA: HAMP domain-containing sensor histidine kinase [Marmoricola sp.]